MTTYELADGTQFARTCANHESGEDITTVLYWHPSDPLVVRVEFIPRDHTPQVWFVSRDLLLDGLSGPTGFGGDIQVWPASPLWVGLFLSNDDGEAEMSLPVDALRDFLAATLHRMPLGTEFAGVDVDAELADLLRGAA